MDFKVSDRPIKALLSSWNEATGKVLVEAAYERTADANDYMVFRFSDGSAILLTEQADDYGWTGAYRIEPRTLDGGGRSNQSDRVYFGLDPLEPYLREREAEAAAAATHHEATERRQLDALRRKYG